MSADAKTILVAGGDGYSGWPLSLRLSSEGYNVVIVDNFSRRKIDSELGAASLTPIYSLRERIAKWKEITSHDIKFHFLDIAQDYNELLSVLKNYDIHSVVHLAEIKSAPYSMKSSWHRRTTVDQNVNSTSNLLSAIVESGSKASFVHLGTMGVYGYGQIDAPIPEGELAVKIKNGAGQYLDYKILYPPSPGSIYHMTKVLDHTLLAYYAKHFGVPCTDLHQGVVWGTSTPECAMDPVLVNRFDYDSDYGTVLNRFLIEAATKNPLTVYGTGGQKRAFIHIWDTINCIKLAIENPPQVQGKVRVFNQVAETRTVIELANIVSKLTGAEIRYHANPRVEALQNELQAVNEGFLNLGWTPILINNELMKEVMMIAARFAEKVDKNLLPPLTAWNSSREVDLVGSREAQRK